MLDRVSQVKERALNRIYASLRRYADFVTCKMDHKPSVFVEQLIAHSVLFNDIREAMPVNTISLNAQSNVWESEIHYRTFEWVLKLIGNIAAVQFIYEKLFNGRWALNTLNVVTVNSSARSGTKAAFTTRDPRRISLKLFSAKFTRCYYPILFGGRALFNHTFLRTVAASTIVPSRFQDVQWFTASQAISIDIISAFSDFYRGVFAIIRAVFAWSVCAICHRRRDLKRFAAMLAGQCDRHYHPSWYGVAGKGEVGEGLLPVGRLFEMVHEAVSIPHILYREVAI